MEVWIGLYWKTRVGEDLVVVCPGWVAKVDGWGSGVEFGQEASAQMDGTCTRNRLHRCYALVSDGWGVCSEYEFGRSAGEFFETGNWEVFVVECWVVAKDLISLFLISAHVYIHHSTLALQYLLNDRQYPWFRIVISVSTDSQIDLALRRVCAISSHETK